MRALIVLSIVTLDGVVQAPGGPEEDPSDGFDQGGWMVGYWDDEIGAAMGESMAPPFDLVLGRKTYEIFAAHWPHRDDPGAEELNSATKHVASTTLTELHGRASRSMPTASASRSACALAHWSGASWRLWPAT